MADIPPNRQSILAVEEASPPVLGSGEGRQVEAEDPSAHERVPQTQVSNKPEATSLLTPARAIQPPLGYAKNFRHCNCYRDYIAVDESAYGCPPVSARGFFPESFYEFVAINSVFGNFHLFLEVDR